MRTQAEKKNYKTMNVQSIYFNRKLADESVPVLCEYARIIYCK